MGERKVQAKYYPPEFDPSKVPRLPKKKQTDSAVRFMLPMSVRCETCGNFMGTGTKFNARKSDTDENYLGVRIFRFSMKCKSCPTTFTIKTDPKNSDYVCESGVKRNYEPWRDKDAKAEEMKEERDRQDQDTIQALENKTADAKKQMEDLDELQEIKLANVRRATQTIDDILQDEYIAKRQKQEREEKRLMIEAKQAFETKRSQDVTKQQMTSSTGLLNDVRTELVSASSHESDKAKVSLNSSWGKLKLKKKIVKPEKQQRRDSKQPLVDLADYPSSSSDEE